MHAIGQHERLCINDEDLVSQTGVQEPRGIILGTEECSS